MISIYVIQFYERIGASLGLLAFFQALARGFDVITDPTMSYISDSCRTKHGRRRPFMFIGAPIYCSFLVCLLTPSPELGEVGTSVWFGVFYIMFFLFYTFCNIPYDALAPELTDNERDRNLLFFTCNIYDGLGGLLAAGMPVAAEIFMLNYRSTNPQLYKSCDQPVDGVINALSSDGPWPFTSTGRSVPPKSVREWEAVLNMSNPAEVFKSSECSVFSEPGYNDTDLSKWCQCRAKSDLFQSLDSTRYGYLWTGVAFGSWALVSLWICVYFVKERMQLNTKQHQAVVEKPPPMVPSVLNTLNNKPFTLLLPAFVLDALATSIITSLLTFFIRYIVEPEFSEGCSVSGENQSWKCQSNLVLGASVMSFLCGALFCTPVWLFAANKLGKRNAWLLWSFTNGATFLCYLPVKSGMVNLCIIMSFFNGAPVGGKFLADSIMADVIDYDEFLTGARSEATYTMFKGFMPKIAAIPASAIPIALMSTFGHKRPVDGKLKQQDDTLKWFIIVAIIYVPSFCAFCAFLIKLRFPLATKEHNDMILQGVAKHDIGLEAMDPCSGEMYRPVHFGDEDAETADLLNYFPGLAVIKSFKKDAAKTSARLIKVAYFQMTLALLFLFGFAGASAGTFRILVSTDRADEDLQFIPVICIVCFGAGITMTGFTAFRLSAAKKLEKHTPNSDTLEKMMKRRQDIYKVRNFKTSICGSLCNILMCKKPKSVGTKYVASSESGQPPSSAVSEPESSAVEMSSAVPEESGTAEKGTEEAPSSPPAEKSSD